MTTDDAEATTSSDGTARSAGTFASYVMNFLRTEGPASVARRVAEQVRGVLGRRDLERALGDPGVAAGRPPAPGDAILFIDATMPRYDQDSGSNRLIQIIEMAAKTGRRVLFHPANFRHEPKYVDALERLGVKTITRPAALAGQIRAGQLGVVWVAKPAPTAFYLPLVRRHSPATRIIYDTVDLQHVRERRQADAERDGRLRQWSERTRRIETEMARLADAVVFVSPDDRRILLGDRPDVPARVIPNIHTPRADGPPPAAARRGLVFVGNYLHTPNVEAARTLAHTIMPTIWHTRPDVTLSIVGSNASSAVTRLGSDRIRVSGWVPDVEAELDRHLVFAGWLRYGSGVKGKIGQALAAGIPVVTTSVGAEGLGLRHGEEALIAADPDSFATETLRILDDEELWARLSRNGIEHVARSFGPEAVEREVAQLLAAPPTKSTPPRTRDESAT